MCDYPFIDIFRDTTWLRTIDIKPLWNAPTVVFLGEKQRLIKTLY